MAPSSEQVIALLESAQSLLEERKEEKGKVGGGKAPMQIEIRTLEFWRAIIGECIATFFYVMLLSSVHQALNHPKDSIAVVQMFSALTAGLAIITLTHAFFQVSGSHFNPAITIAAALMKKISILRAAAYICAQCGGAIAGAALVYGVYGRNGAKDQFGPASISNFGMEFILSFLVSYVYFSAAASAKARALDSLSSSVSIGLAYMTALSAYRGSLNPARALGPAFVADAFAYHWVFWVGPILGAACGAFCYTFIFNLNKPRWVRDKDAENVSMKSEDDIIDDLERVRQYKASMMATYNDNLHTTTSLYNTAVNPYKGRQGGAESVYGGTKSLYNGGVGYSGRRTPAGFDSKSMYGGMDEEAGGRQRSHSQLKRSMSVHSKMARRNPQDLLPDEPARSAQLPSRQQTEHHHRQLSQLTDKAERAEGYASEQMYREYIRQKNAAADQNSPIEQLSGNSCQEQLSGSSSGQCSGGSSGYYSSAREQQQELRMHEEQLRAEAQLKSEQLHRRDRSFGSSRGEQLRMGARPANYPSSNSSYGGY